MNNSQAEDILLRKRLKSFFLYQYKRDYLAKKMQYIIFQAYGHACCYPSYSYTNDNTVDFSRFRNSMLLTF